MDVDDDLSWAGDRVGRVTVAQHLQSAMVRQQHRFHCLVPLQLAVDYGEPLDARYAGWRAAIRSAMRGAAMMHNAAASMNRLATNIGTS